MQARQNVGTVRHCSHCLRGVVCHLVSSFLREYRSSMEPDATSSAPDPRSSTQLLAVLGNAMTAESTSGHRSVVAMKVPSAVTGLTRQSTTFPAFFLPRISLPFLSFSTSSPRDPGDNNP